MFPFRTRHHAAFSCAADFSSGAVVNIHFFDQARETIRFHVSLRRDEQLIVVNRRDRAGWRREVKFPFTFRAQPVAVEMIFERARATLSVGGQFISQFDAFPRPDRHGRFHLRRGFPGLKDIAFVDIEGPFQPRSLTLHCADMATAPSGRVVLNDAVEVVLDGLNAEDQAAFDQAGLVIAGFDERIPAHLRALPYTLPGKGKGERAHALAAAIPGRVWDSGVDTLQMTLEGSAGKALGTLEISRAQLAAHLGALAMNGGMANDDRIALQAIEHIRHARLLPLMTPEQSQGALAAAARFRLGAYLIEGTEPGAGQEPAVQLPDVDAEWLQVEDMRSQFARTMRNLPAGNGVTVLQELIASSPRLSEVGRMSLYLALAEWACVNDTAWDLVRQWRLAGLSVPAGMPGADIWTLSARLPFLYAEGRFEEVATTLAELTGRTDGWVLTPCIGWIAKQAARASADLEQRLPSTAERRAIIAALQGWIAAEAQDYWGRTRCTVLIRGMVALLAEGHSLPGDDHESLSRQLLWVYGLCPSFWAAVTESQAEEPWALPPAMNHPRKAFNALQALLGSEAGRASASRSTIDTLLAPFTHAYTVDLARFRRDLLGPAGVVGDAETGFHPYDCTMAGLDADEAALRFMAFPQDRAPAALPDADLTRAAKRGLISAYSAVPKGAMNEAQRDLLTDARALLAGKRDAGTAEPGTNRILRRMVAVASPENAFLGLGIGLSLVQGLLDQKRMDEANRFAARVIAIADSLKTDADRAQLGIAPAPQLALAALIRAHGDHPLVKRLAAQLEPVDVALVAYPAQARLATFDTPVDPLLDTVVCLYTCRANLDTRVAAIRAGWMRDLAEQGVPCLVFVGDGNGEQVGDVVHLQAPDSYEGLPQKSLAMVRWVLENTDYAHLVKVDDDCFLDPRAFFGDLTFRKFHYYGRRLTRVRGQMDRAWHMAKSKSARGRLELDKSPEPSTYADGGSGYVLSRVAMAALTEAAQSLEGRELSHISFMEDKLVGDLLGLRGIEVVGEDYRVSVLRRTMPGGPLVPAWENGFLPFAGADIKLVHLDGHEKQAEVLAASASPWPQSHKIWPSYQSARLGWCSNTLDLISATRKLESVNAAPVALIACMRNEMFMLPRFLEHYRAMGVEGFLIADNGSDDGSFEYLVEQPDVALFAVDTDYSASRYGVAWQQALMSNFRTNRWSLLADADELLFWSLDRSGRLPDLLPEFDDEGATAARVFMLDMYPEGSLSSADFASGSPFDQAGFVDRDPFLTTSTASGPFSNSAIWTSALRHRLIPGSRAELFVAQKYALMKYQPWMQLSAGLHFVADAKVSRRELFFAHFKYNAAFRAKAEAEVMRQQHFNNAEEYRKYLALVSEGRDVVFDAAVSVPWDQADFVRSRCR